MLINLFRKYNQNKKAIWTIIIAIVFSYFILQAIYGLLRNNREKEREELINKINENAQISSNNPYNNSQDIKQEIIVNDNKKNSKEIIEQFVEYCNNNKVEDAYSMLSKDCKTVLFPNINLFKSNYVNKIFNQSKTAKIEREIYGNGIYKVTYLDNILQSGGKQSKEIIDYIYVTDEDESKFLSLNKFLYIKSLEVNSKSDGINIEIIEKQIFIDYEIYTIKITNNTENDILIADKNDVNNINLTDINDVKYSSYIDELASEMLVLQKNGTKTINIKFNKAFSINRKLNYMNFNIIMDYKAYMNGRDFKTLKQSVKL